MNEIDIEKELNKAVSNSAISLLTGFVLGFFLGSFIVAILDYYDNKKDKQKRIKNGSDENYITSN